jgi:hypothetical protein
VIIVGVCLVNDAVIVGGDPDGHTQQFGRIIVVIMMTVYAVMVQ